MNWQAAVERTVTGLGYDLVDVEHIEQRVDVVGRRLERERLLAADAAPMAAMVDGSRPSEKLGTHSIITGIIKSAHSERQPEADP